MALRLWQLLNMVKGFSQIDVANTVRPRWGRYMWLLDFL